MLDAHAHYRLRQHAGALTEELSAALNQTVLHSTAVVAGGGVGVGPVQIWADLNTASTEVKQVQAVL